MGLSKSNPPNAQVKLLVSPTGRMPWSWISWFTIAGGSVLLVAVILSGAKLIVDPYSPNWLKQVFPSLTTSFEAPPQTIDEIQAELRSQNLTTASPLAWPNPTKPTAWFYPLLDDDQAIRELWVYRVRGQQLQRMDQVTIRPMRESFVTTPLVGTAAQVTSIDSDANVSSVSLIPGVSTTVPWLLLEGQRRYGNTVMRYGQILSYQTSAHRLHQVLKWSSPVEQPLQWYRDQTASLFVIDQTVGLRPNFLVHQLVPNDPPQLKELSVYRSAYDTELETSLYTKALQLAQGAVWSHSLQMMESAKVALAERWLPEAEFQLRLIRFHALQTKAQTEQTWSNQQQHIWTYLIDGQWEDALARLESHPEIYQSILNHLEKDFEPLWRQVTIHLQVHPKDSAAQIWGALLVTARQTSEAGADWLKERPHTQKTLERLQAVGQSQISVADVLPPQAPKATVAVEEVSAGTGRYLSLVGEATAVAAVGDGWLRSQTLPTPVPGQTWYHIQIHQLQDPSGWQTPLRGTTAANFWAESLSLRRQLQLFKGNQPIGSLAIHGVKENGTQLTLLGIGPKVEGLPLLTTVGNDWQWMALLPWRWLPTPNLSTTISSSNGSDNVNHQEVAQSSSEALMLEALGNHLALTPEQTMQLFSHLLYASRDLVGDSAEEHLFSIGNDVPQELNLTSGKTLILSSTGDLLYSDVNQTQSLLGFTSKSPNQSAVLLIQDASRYQLIGL
ncbi:MAG: hypothetical protein AAF821_13645 [Cyanobacteria bacterium P01_D01_bin.156]